MEHLLTDERKSPGGEVSLPLTPEFSPRVQATQDLGTEALSRTLNTLTVIHETVALGGENMVNNQEGVQNAELFKQKYDEAIESIDSALGADADNLVSKIPAILSCIDALHATPYVSSVPEFVAMVKAARSSIETIDSFIALGGKDTEFVANAVSLAKQQLSGTLVAYRPQR